MSLPEMPNSPTMETPARTQTTRQCPPAMATMAVESTTRSMLSQRSSTSISMLASHLLMEWQTFSRTWFHRFPQGTTSRQTTGFHHRRTVTSWSWTRGTLRSLKTIAILRPREVHHMARTLPTSHPRLPTRLAMARASRTSPLTTVKEWTSTRMWLWRTRKLSDNSMLLTSRTSRSSWTQMASRTPWQPKRQLLSTLARWILRTSWIRDASRRDLVRDPWWLTRTRAIITTRWSEEWTTIWE